MRKARLILSASLLTIGTFSAVTFSSCSKDDPICPTGMEGKNCDVEMRTKFVKTWSASDVVNGNQLVYSCTIAKGININSVTISNTFADNFFSNNINATVNGNTITVAKQTPDANGDFSVSGQGTYQNGQIVWTYLIVEDASGDDQNYSGTWQ